jgi:uncharacterized protein (TIGR03437 family)
MSMRRFSSAAVCLSLALTAALQAQDVFVLPGAGSTGRNVAVYSGGSTFAPINASGFQAGPGAFLVLARPDGAKFYVIANSPTATVTVVDSAFANPRSLGNLGQAATAAVLTPDGSKLVVAAGTLHIFDTSTDAEAVNGGVAGIGSVIDVAVGLDGSKAYALSTSGANGGQLNAVDLTSDAVVATLSISAAPTGIAVGPNGLVYVSALNQVLEIKPVSLTLTSAGAIAVNGRPGRLVFTPDGAFALAVNQTPATGSSAILLDLNARTVSNTVPSFGTVLDNAFVAGPRSFYVFSSQTHGLFQVPLANGNVSINPVQFPGVNANITAATTSNEVPVGGRAAPQFLYLVAGNVLYRINLSTNAVDSQFNVQTSAANALSFAGPAVSGSPATILQFGNNQNVALNSVSGPIVVRVFDSQGHPLIGQVVTFSANNGAVVQPTSVTTGADGFAETFVTASSTVGLATVTATVGTLSANFSVNMGAGSGGGTSGGTGVIKIIGGQGQILTENTQTGFNSPLSVKLTDASGQPLVNAPVTFALASGFGSLVDAADPSAPNTVTVNTDANGVASTAFATNVVPFTLSFIQSTITAGSPGLNTVTFFVTTVPSDPSKQPAIALIKPQPGDTVTGPAGGTVPAAIVALVTSYLGLPIPNVAITVNSNGADPTQFASGSCADPTGQGVLSDSNGRASCDLVLNNKVGLGQLFVNIGNIVNAGPFQLRIVPGAPANVQIVQGNNQSGTPGQTLPLALVVVVTDAGGNILAGVPVTWQVLTPNGVTLTNIISTTDGNGHASALPILGNVAGNAQVKVTAGPSSAIFTLTVNVAVGGIQTVSGGNQTALVNTAFGAPLVVKVTDAKGNPVAGVQVTFAVAGGGATVGSATATTDANGNASTTVQAGATAGPITVTASTGAFNTTFTLTAGIPGPGSQPVFLNGASFQPGISPGAIAIIQDPGIATGIQGVVQGNTNLVGPLPTTLAGVKVTFNGVAAPIFYVANVNGKEQVAVQVPFETLPGTATVVITGPGGGTFTASNVPIQPFAPGVFQLPGAAPAGQDPFAVVQRPDGSYVSAANPARRGEIDCLFATGLGQVSPNASTNSGGVAGQSLLARFDVGINNAGVRVVSSQYLPGTVGVYEICFQVPSDAATGATRPLGLVIHDSSGDFFAQSTNIPVQ